MLVSLWTMFHVIYSIDLSPWDLATDSLPSDSLRICGYNEATNTIFTLGGWNNRGRVITYDLFNDEITTDDTALPQDVNIFCYGRCSTFYGNYLYFINNQKIGRFNMDDSTSSYPLSSATVTAHGSRTCIAISDTGAHLFIIGGMMGSQVGSNIFQIYNIQTGYIYICHVF